MEDAEKRAQSQQESEQKDGNEEQMVVQFWDEINTCPHQPVLKKILVDRINPRTGRAIHSGLRFVAACNPWRKLGTVVAVGFESPDSGHDRLRGLAYRVHPIPESLFGCLSSFGQLDSETEMQYVREMASQPVQIFNAKNCLLPVPCLSAAMCEHVTSYVWVVHQFFRNLDLCVSLRDPSRLFKLWGFIRWEMAEKTRVSKDKEELIPLVLALHLTYEVAGLKSIVECIEYSG